MSGTNSPLHPTYIGLVRTTKEALVLFEACLGGRLNHVPRRPHDRERKNLIQSGYIFIYEEHASGIKRWTDGINWSPSRILGNFLVYRELNGNISPGEKKRALKNKSPTNRRPSSNGGVVKHSHSGSQSSLNSHRLSNPGFSADQLGALGSGAPDMDPTMDLDDKDPLRQLVGSLTDSYDFKEPEGLVKKTISVKIGNVTHHLVNYYSIEHALTGELKGPWEDPHFNGISIRPSLYDQPGFRVPIGPDCYDEAGNGYIANIVGSTPINGRVPSIPAPLPLPGQRQYHDDGQFDAPNYSNSASHMAPLPAQLATHFPPPFGGHFPTQLGGGYPQMNLAGYNPQASVGYQGHSSFDGQFDSQFDASPTNGTSFKVEPQDGRDAHSGYPDHAYGTSQSLTNGEAAYHLEDSFADYPGQ